MSSITLTFNSVPAIDTNISILNGINPGGLIETFKASRSVIGESTQGSGIDACMFNFTQAFNIDYNNTNLYTIDLNTTTKEVTITGTNDDVQFSIESNTTAGAITTNINNVVVPSFSIDTVIVSEADTNPCDNVKISLNCSEQADNISTPISQVVGTNPFVFDTPRADAIKFTMNKGSLSDAVKYRIPQLLSVYFDVNIINTTSGASISVQRLYPLTNIGLSNTAFPLTFEYSLDGILWQSSNAWSGLSPDSYTMHVRDNIGCEINFPFTVDAFTPNLVDYDAICEISNANSIRYKENVVWDDENRKTPENTLSFEEETTINHRNFVQWLQKTDSPITQVMTNYDTITAKLIDCDGVETDLTVTKVTDNMDKTDTRDIHAYNFTDGQYNGSLGVYFGSGKTYDPDTQIENGSYNIGVATPDFVNIGDYINLQGVGWLPINDIITNQDTGGDVFQTVLVLGASHESYTYTNGDAIIGTSIYNVVDFERYEYTVDASTLDGNYYVKTTFTDATFPTKEFISEWLSVKDEHPCHFLIDYYGSENNEINYSTGVVNRIRIPRFLPLKKVSNEEQDIYVTDTQVIALENTYRRNWEFNPLPVPTGIEDKLQLMLAHDKIRIDGKTYLKEGQTDSVKIGSTNTYNLKAILAESDYVFDSNRGLSSSEITIPQGVLLDISSGSPGFLLVE